jgi:hypothetical protein
MAIKKHVGEVRAAALWEGSDLLATHVGNIRAWLL